MLCAVAPGNGDALRGAACHIGTVGRHDSRRIAMRPIPGHVVCIGGVDVAGRWGHAGDGLAVRRLVIEAVNRPEAPKAVSAAMPERMPYGRMRHRACRSKT